jgi:hypothetical protein
MKILCIAIAFALAAVAPACAGAPQPAPEKDFCLLDHRACTSGQYDLVTKTARIRNALANGDLLYSREERELLGKKLEECLEITDLLDVPETTIPRE